MSRRILFCALAAAGLAACGTPVPAPAKGDGGKEAADPKAPVARFDGQTITAGELDAKVKPEMQKLEGEYQQRVYEVKKGALEAMVVMKAVESRAKAAGKSVEDYVRGEVLAKTEKPTEAEAKEIYERAKAGGRQLPPFEQVKADIQRFLEQQKQQAALQAYYEQVKRDAKTEILLPAYRPPKVAVAAEGPSRGPAQAPVTIVEFSDFQCPYCSRAETVVNEVLAAYKDKVRLVYRDYPLPGHADATKAAEAAHCAGDQNKYWEMHGRLFANQQKLDVPSLKAHAKALGLDQGAFDKCLDSGEKAKVVEANRKAGEEAGVTGTPAFFVNGVLISGAQPLEAFKTVIDAELAAKK
jgi:protein-disulfide isomerase